MSIFVYEPDLIFSSKFGGLSHLIEKDFKIFTDLTTLLKDARSEKPAAFIINLDATKPEVVRNVVTFGVPVMGYYSHVNAETARVAAQLGVNPVVTVLSLLVLSHSFVNCSALGGQTSSLLHVAFCVTTIVDRSFQNKGQRVSSYVFENGSEPFFPNVPQTDMLVPVSSAPQFSL